MPGALEGIRVTDLSHVLAGPTTSMILADLGAQVIHVEPPSGDDARQFGPFQKGQSAYFVSINRNKKSIAVDLKKSQGKRVFQDLVRASDVLLENYRPATMGKLGLSYEQLKRINPKIIYASISGFGHETLPQYMNKPAYDMVAQAFSGLMSICGPEGGPPVRVGTSLGDIIAGHQCAIAILSALWHRQKTGRGQKIDQSMVDGLVSILENAIVRYTVSDQIPGPLGTMHPSITPFQAFKTRDSWIVIPIGNDTLWQKFCHLLERPELTKDERFQTNALRTQNRAQLIPLLQAEIGKKSTGDWIHILNRHNLPCSPVNTIDRVVEDANLKYRELIVNIRQPGAGLMTIAGSPYRLSETPGRVYGPAPLLGEHTEEVLMAVAGYSPEEVKRLRAAGAVYTREDLDRSES